MAKQSKNRRNSTPTTKQPYVRVEAVCTEGERTWALELLAWFNATYREGQENPRVQAIASGFNRSYIVGCARNHKNRTQKGELSPTAGEVRYLRDKFWPAEAEALGTCTAQPKPQEEPEPEPQRKPEPTPTPIRPEVQPEPQTTLQQILALTQAVAGLAARVDSLDRRTELPPPTPLRRQA